MIESSPPPVLFDFQVNGFGGVDFQRDDLTAADWRRAVTALEGHRTRAIFVTLVTAEIEVLCRRFERIERFRAADPALARMVPGYHLEGPWLLPEPGFHGAHPRGPMHAPQLAEFQRLQNAAGGRIALVTLAPEWPGTTEFIAELVRGGVHVSLGHTNASEAQIDAAIAAGARFATHVGNGTPGVLPRHDNVIQRLLARDELTACLIPDGIHLPPFALKNFFRAKPPGRVLFTTDCMAGAGAPPGRYTLGELTVEIGPDRVVRQPGGSGLAGSALAPDEGVSRIESYLGLSPEAALNLWSAAPLTAFGVDLKDD